MDAVERIVNRIKSEEGRIGIISHFDPDGDAIGSVLGMYNFLKKFKRNVEVILKDEVPYLFKFLPGSDEIKREPDGFYDLMLLLDASDISRTGFDKIEYGDLVRIDHHKTGTSYSDFDYLSEKAPSATVLVLDILKNYDESAITREVAEPLYAGLLTDTGGFKYGRDFKISFEAALYLAGKGIDCQDIAQKIFLRKKLRVFKLLSLALETLTVVEDKIAYIVLRKEFFERTGTDSSDSQSFVTYPLSVDDVAVGIKFTEVDENFWKVSLRGKNVVDLATIAEEFGGGGHKNAAGLRITGDEESVINAVVSRILKEFQ